VAGIFGLMVSLAPQKSADELSDLLRATAKQSTFATPDAMGHDDFYGYGQVQPALALKMLQPPAMPSGCGCEVGGAGISQSWALLLLVLLLRRRR
jgi:uncharacterized protein (TIGR03382 family)